MFYHNIPGVALEPMLVLVGGEEYTMGGAGLTPGIRVLVVSLFSSAPSGLKKGEVKSRFKSVSYLLTIQNVSGSIQVTGFNVILSIGITVRLVDG